MAAEDRADRSRLVAPDRRDVEPELKARPSPWDPRHAVAEAVARDALAVCRGRKRDSTVGVEMVDMGGLDETVHGRVDRRRGPAPAEQAVVEGGDHLVLALDARIDVDERAQPIEPEHAEARFGQRPEIAARTLDPEEVDGRGCHWVDGGPFRGGVAARVVRVAGIRSEPVGSAQELSDRIADRRTHAPHPACAPPTRSAAVRSAYPERT